MRKYPFILAAALALTAGFAGANVQTPAEGARPLVTISPEDLQQQVDGRSLPLTYIEQPY